jgi:hypothetical protein
MNCPSNRAMAVSKAASSRAMSVSDNVGPNVRN